MSINKNELEAGTELATYRTRIKMVRRFNNDVAEVTILNPDTDEELGRQHVIVHHFEPYRDVAHKAVVRWLESCGVEVLMPDNGDTDPWFTTNEPSAYDPGIWVKWDVFIVQVANSRTFYGFAPDAGSFEDWN